MRLQTTNGPFETAKNHHLLFGLNEVSCFVAIVIGLTDKLLCGR